MLLSDCVAHGRFLIVVGAYFEIVDNCFQCNLAAAVNALLVNVDNVDVQQPVGRQVVEIHK